MGNLRTFQLFSSGKKVGKQLNAKNPTSDKSWVGGIFLFYPQTFMSFALKLGFNISQPIYQINIKFYTGFGFAFHVLRYITDFRPDQTSQD